MILRLTLLLTVMLIATWQGDAIACSTGYEVVLCMKGAIKPACSRGVVHCAPRRYHSIVRDAQPPFKPRAGRGDPQTRTYDAGAYELTQFSCVLATCLTVAKHVADALVRHRRVRLVCMADQLKAPAPRASGKVETLTTIIFVQKYRHLGTNGRFAAQRCASLMLAGHLPFWVLMDALNHKILTVNLVVGRSHVSAKIHRGIIATIQKR